MNHRMVIQHTLLVFLIWSGVNLGSLSQAASAPTDFDSLKQEYCETPVSEQTIAKNFFSHFGVLHNDPQYYQDQIELGAPWQRTVVLNFNLNEIAEGRLWTDNDALVKELDSYVMRAQLRATWLMIELYVFRPIQNMQRVEEVLKLVAERYDHDGLQDMPCLKYPVKHFGLGNELSGTFKGTAQDFLDILKVTHAALSEANPDVIMVQAGMVPFNINDPDRQMWNSLFSMGAQEYIDISVFHEIQGQENFISIMFYPTYFLEQCFRRPMWINELEFEYTPDALSLTQEQYAPIYVRYMTYALAHGVDKLFFASFKNPPPHIPPDMPAPFTDASALIDSRDQRTLLFHVVQTFIQRFDYFSSVEILVEKIEAAEYSHKEKAKLVTEGQYKFVVDGKTHYILWGTGGVPAEIKGDLIVTDIFGKTSERNANAVVLTTEPIYVTLK